MMTFQSVKFFIGLMDFFSMLLPGALLTYLLMGELGDRYDRLHGAEAWGILVRELSLLPPGLSAQLLAGRALRLSEQKRVR